MSNRLSNRILSAEEGEEQDAAFAEQHFDFHDDPPEHETRQPSANEKSKDTLPSADAQKISVEMATGEDNEIVARSREEYVDAFRSGLLRTARSILEMCRTVYEAKKSLADPEFDQFCHEIGYAVTSSTIRKYAIIGKVYPRLIEHVDKLPASWTSLYLITQIANDTFEQLIRGPDSTMANIRGAELTEMTRSTKNESMASVLPIDKPTKSYVFAKLMFTKKPDDTDWRAMRKALAELEARLPVRCAVNSEAQRIWDIQKMKRYEQGKTKYQAIEFKPEAWDLGRDADAAIVTPPKKDDVAA